MKTVPYGSGFAEGIFKKMAGKFQRVGVIVLGMHRSGTSALTRSLNIMGCSLPASLMPAGYGNELGHWESGAVAAYNDHILERLGSDWSDYQPIDPRWFDNPAFGDVMDRAVAMLDEEYGESRLFVLKDPRMCRLVPFWQEAMARAQIAPHYVLAIRNPLEVAASLTRRDGIERDYGLLLWLCHVLEAERHTRGHVRCVCAFDSLLQNPEAQLFKISQGLSLKWPRNSITSRQEVRHFLDGSARHHTIPAVGLDDPSLMLWVPQVAGVFSRWIEGGEVAEDYELLDRVWSSFHESAVVFGDLVLTGRRARRRCEELEQAVAVSHAMEQRMSSVDDEMNWLRGKADTADRSVMELEALRQVMAEKDNEMGWLRARADRVEALEALLAGQAELVRNTEIAQEANTALRAELFQANFRLETALGEADRRGQINEEQQRELQALREDSALLRVRLAEVDSHLRQRQEEVAQSWAALEETQRQNALLVQERERERQEAEGRAALHAIRLDEANGWVFRLAGERQAEGARAARAERLREQDNRELRSLQAELARSQAEVEQSRREMAERLQGEVAAKAALQETIAGLEKAMVALRSSHEAGQQNEEARQRLEERTGEIVTLTRILQQSQTELDARQHEVGLVRKQGDWLRAVNNEMLRRPAWWGVMPRAWREQRFYQRLAEKGLFDRDAYLANNADVAAAGIDPLRHYIMHGSIEGRTFS